MSRIYIQQIEVEKCTDEFCNFNMSGYNGIAECCYNGEDNSRIIKTKNGRFPRWCPLHKKVSELKIHLCKNCFLQFTDKHRFIRCVIDGGNTVTEQGKDFPKHCRLGVVILTRR